MKLPNVNKAIISREKLTNYILSKSHPVGKFKARFFQKLGFNENNVHIFEKMLRKIARSQEVTAVLPTIFGTKYIIDVEIKTHKEKYMKIRSVWIIGEGENKPRFVTVYPV